jgi:hypothetical protein
MAIAIALVVVAGALAASDPFGFWRSTNPGAARFGIDSARHVQTPTYPAVGCVAVTSVRFRCAPGSSGRSYTLIDRVPQPPTASQMSRTAILSGVSQAKANGQISPATAHRIEADVAAVPNSFFTGLRTLMSFGTYGWSYDAGPSGRGLVPPAGVPSELVCEQAAAALTCVDFNGDEHAPVGAGVYAAVRSRDWVRAPRPEAPGVAGSLSERLTEAVFGRPLRPAEQRILIDLLMTASGSAGSTSSG